MRHDTKIANIKLVNRKHKYLRVIIRYGAWIDKIFRKENFIINFFPAETPKEGMIIWPK